MGNPVDLHTHIFNVLFLPINGIAVQWCRDNHISESIGKRVAALLNAIAHAHSGPFAVEEKTAKQEALRVEALLKEADTGERGEDGLLEDMARRLPDTAVAADELVGPFVKIAFESIDARKRALVDYTIREMYPATPRSLFPTIRGWIHWVFLMTLHERVIFFLLRHLHRGVDLYVTHMMDMDNYYPDGRSEYEFFTVQIDRMLRVQKSHRKKMRVFVAYDPKREREIDRMKRALADGCAGIKFYPPNGYAPIGNGQKIDAALGQLYDFCVTNDVPLFTHCTPVGFEARKEYGCKSDPKLWRKVLDGKGDKDWNTLRLCFGHAGGEVGWFSLKPEKPPTCEPPDKNFADEVIAICSTKKYPNVFCEFGYLNELREEGAPAKLQAKLIKAIAASENGKELATRICFGTDWHMPQMFIKGASPYLRLLRGIFQHRDLAKYADGFFAGNARRFLKMETA